MNNNTIISNSEKLLKSDDILLQPSPIQIPVPVPKEELKEVEDVDKKATALLFIGMAGTGKTCLLQRINSYLSQTKKKRYILNLDPAVAHLPYHANIDIRDTVDYKAVMRQYSLGPNGGILTSLNLFTTKFDQVLDLVEARVVDYILIDTPGQIELFTWSASGSIISECLSNAFPTCVLYIIDTPRASAPVTFMSNMLYACSILYKTKLPFVLIFNKIDVLSHATMVEWMSDFDVFHAALIDDETYMSSLVSSMAVVLEEFYRHLRVVGVSAATGQGMQELFVAVDQAVIEYHSDYKPNIMHDLELAKVVNDLELAKDINDLSLSQ